jgi:hypothetical protein
MPDTMKNPVPLKPNYALKVTGNSLTSAAVWAYSLSGPVI